MQISKEQKKALSDATNLLCKFVDGNLPPGWTIELHMSRGESYFDLTDPAGDSVTCDSSDSPITEMCEAAEEDHEQYALFFHDSPIRSANGNPCCPSCGTVGTCECPEPAAN